MTHYIVIVGALVVAGFIVLFIITAMWERQVLSGDVEPVTEPYPYSPSAYWLATRDAATQLGLGHAGDFATKKHTTLVKGMKSLWVTQDNPHRCVIIQPIANDGFDTRPQRCKRDSASVIRRVAQLQIIA